MKFCILLVINLLCLNCSIQEASTSTNNGASVIHTANVAPRIDSNESQTVNGDVLSKVNPDHQEKLINFRVDAYEDEKLVIRRFYNNGQLRKEVTFNIETNTEEYVTEYFYAKDGNFKKLKVTKGDASVFEEIFSRSVKDFKVQHDFLKSKGIDFPLADIVINEISDLSNVFSVADNYHDFKAETQTNGNQKVIKFIGFNKTSRFHNSPIALLIGNGDFINIKDYELTLENGFPLEEIYRTRDGDLTKTYSYKNGKLTSVAYQFTDLKNQTNSLKKQFEYHELK